MEIVEKKLFVEKKHSEKKHFLWNTLLYNLLYPFYQNKHSEFQIKVKTFALHGTGANVKFSYFTFIPNTGKKQRIKISIKPSLPIDEFVK